MSGLKWSVRLIDQKANKGIIYLQSQTTKDFETSDGANGKERNNHATVIQQRLEKMEMRRKGSEDETENPKCT